ncbi:MAG: NADH-quinone oxidoreductase subunit NuoE [Candidatus Krumholzibacteria bacterium]|jgi:NADH-quinone oxidoreductase E subunit|nr:NADH-quinone oxidoreductase subunit NuoE [Candidatus Krumholzibacteria bacterium]MDP6668659.1 NADH-quinone oxidoreductase subunit NuoE [Candidatus Krumholzibacteria bacterium]MDP6796344.1 NADH-quinone oxidoreductase subunit NuoE [Candidatus Krumholzibacteria bacterium]MDP7021030.1 NADH-quinone oxidoreductase subunit NuoE [Candidatus Krumholzibacteria bacterium]
MFRDEILSQIEELKSRYPNPDSALLPALHLLQGEEGWISPETMEEIAKLFGMSPARVEGVVTFYSMYFTRPMGKHVIQLCRTLSCDLMGAFSIREAIAGKIGIAPGETSEDGRFSLVEVECLGACGTAPAMMIGDDLYENLDADKVNEILDRVEN